MRHVKHTLLTAPALIVTLGALATATAQANVITCSNGQIPWGPPGSRKVLAYNESAPNVSCPIVHRVIAESYIGRGGAPVYGPNMTNPPGWHCYAIGIWVTQRQWVLNDITGAIDRCTSGNRAFRFTWGRPTRWWVNM